MLIIETGTTDPWFNLAAEEYFFRKADNDIFILYINDISVIIGKHQNPFEEVNIRFLQEQDIPLIRRISGGGTVYHDPGNLNYTYIRNIPDGKKVDFRKYTQPVITFLNRFAVNAYRGEKNEIRTEGLKISGNAEHVFKNRLLHHGTLLYSADMKLMSECLAAGNAIIESRAVKSNRTDVINLCDIIKQIDNIKDLQKQLFSFVCETNPFAEEYIISSEDRESINKIRNEKFRTWEWNYAYGPEFTFYKEFEIEGLPSSVKLKVAKGIIEECIFNGPSSWKKLEIILPGTRMVFNDIERVLLENNLPADTDHVYNFLS